MGPNENSYTEFFARSQREIVGIWIGIDIYLFL